MATGEVLVSENTAAPTTSESHLPRLTPAIVIVALYWIARIAVNTIVPGTFTQFLTLFYAPMALALAFVVWLAFFSRYPWRDRLWSIGSMAATLTVALLLADKSVNWMAFLMHAAPVAITAAVAWQWIVRRQAGWSVRLGTLAVWMLAWHAFTLVRIDGIEGDFGTQWAWRWSPSAEEQYLASLPAAKDAPPVEDAAPLVASEADWPAFRGSRRDGVVHGVKINKDWNAHPPREVWRRRIGPGWSSFTVIGGRAFTQEQRGEEEAITCIDLETGKEIWSHSDKTRFWEVVAGAGPRGTPTFDNGKLYSLGGSGRLNCLDAATGKVLWTRELTTDTGAKAPQWGFASSPLVAGGVVLVLGNDPGQVLVAYDAESGDHKWNAGKGKHTYSSPQLWSANGTDQVLVVSDHGLEAVDPASGKVLWEHNWFLQGMFRVIQPHVLDDGRILIGTGMGNGTRLLQVVGEGEAWEVDETWTTKDLKPYFNDFVSRDGFGYGFDDAVFTCIDLATGKRQWKKGRYGYGQVLLLGDQGLLIVLSEKGEAVLLEANPKRHVELGRFQALNGKTWNHPVVVGNQLLVRNSEEMACYELAAE